MMDFDRDSMLEMFIFEMSQQIDQLEGTIVQSESEYNSDQINEIFRIMHTIKGSSAMMMYDSIASVAHSIEDLFYYLREENPTDIDYARLSDYVLSGMDFIKAELGKIQGGNAADGDGTALSTAIENYLVEIKEHTTPEEAPAPTPPPAPERVQQVTDTAVGGNHKYQAKIHFQDGCEMENIRAFTFVHNLQEVATDIEHTPENVIDEKAIAYIRKNGFGVQFSSIFGHSHISEHIAQTIYLKSFTLETISATASVETIKATPAPKPAPAPLPIEEPVITSIDPFPVATTSTDSTEQAERKAGSTSQMINVNVNKLDSLLNLLGELVIAEAMVTQNSELEGLQLDSFHKEASNLNKIISELRQIAVTLRMLPLSATFLKMRRVVRDMSRQLNKEVDLEIAGEETEVDKNIIEQMADPILHIIRNSLDHGVESPEERIAAGKPPTATVRLEAMNAGGDVVITIQDDGRGIDTEKVLKKARESGLTNKPDHEYTDKEIQQFLFVPGFSTNDEVTAFSGRGVGMDVVHSNLEFVGGTVLVDSSPGEGTTFTLKIPLTLAIIEGMGIMVAGVQYTIPIANIIKSFKANAADLFKDPDGNEMITNRSDVFNVVRLHEFFNIQGAITDIEEGMLVMLENGERVICLLVDKLVGQQQVVVKPIPSYFRKVRGLGGCTLLGNGDVSLIIDVAGFYDN
ncbi:MAG: chemotaxis protein CheA [Defluviitaleaceae bacterium]|nr:chemotaxis protein CheA [Defluviitaleaceae bacterium]